MKLCVVVPYFTPYVRGNEYGLAESLTKLGYEVTIIASKAKAPREIKKNFSGEYTFEVNYLPTIVDVGENPLVHGLDIKDYDVALLQEDYPFICHRAYTEAKKQGIKTILSSERTYYPKGIKGAVLKILDKGKNKELREGVDALTAHCTAAKEFMERELGIEREIKVIHVGVDTELFRPMKPMERYLSEGEFKILTVARLHKYKGLEYLIEAMQLLRKKSEAKLYVLGNGPEEMRLKRRVKSLGLERTVAFLHASIPNYEMPFLYGECDVYVQPSIIEPYGIAVLEAMACGKPVIGTRVGGMLDTIKDGETGFLVEPESAEEIAERIMSLEDDNKRAEMGMRAREWVVTNFDWTVIGKRYQEAIKELV
jgi:glycosyltransferase involved in cell wall biosynthesis